MQANDCDAAAACLAATDGVDRASGGVWPAAYAPLPGREHLTEPIEPIP